MAPRHPLSSTQARRRARFLLVRKFTVHLLQPKAGVLVALGIVLASCGADGTRPHDGDLATPLGPGASGKGDGSGLGGWMSGETGVGGTGAAEAANQLSPLFPNASRDPENVAFESGAIVSRFADRGRRRHEPSCIADELGHGPDTCDFDNYHFMYWTHGARTLDWTLVDRTPSGSSELEFTVDMKSPHGQNGADVGQNAPNLRCFTVYGTVTGFHQNYVMQPLDGPLASATVFRHTLTNYSAHDGSTRPLATGDLVECEVTMRWQELVLRGFQANYYSRRIRYIVGSGGIRAFNGDPNIGPVSLDPEQLLGGGTTDTVRAPGERERSYMQFSLNGSHGELTRFLDGRRLFRTSFVDGVHRDPTGTADPESAQPRYEEMALGVVPQVPESAARCANCHENDGSGPRFPGMRRAAPALVGLGLLEAIDGDELLANEAWQGSGATRSGNVRGVLSRLERGGKTFAGRFGWTADAIDIEEQIRRALGQEMGVVDGALTDDAVAHLVDYVRLLAVPAPRSSNLLGEPGFAVFEDAGCGDCHLTRTYETGAHPLGSLRSQTIRPLTDLLLHDMGGEEPYRTPPLWGIGLRAVVRGEHRYLHDDSATSLEQAIDAHRGEGAWSARAFAQLGEPERRALLAWLEAL